MNMNMNMEHEHEHEQEHECEREHGTFRVFALRARAPLNLSCGRQRGRVQYAPPVLEFGYPSNNAPRPGGSKWSIMDAQQRGQETHAMITPPAGKKRACAHKNKIPASGGTQMQTGVQYTSAPYLSLLSSARVRSTRTNPPAPNRPSCPPSACS